MLDIIIVGAGIRLKQLKPDLNVAILEKASTIGGHLISGTILQKKMHIWNTLWNLIQKY